MSNVSIDDVIAQILKEADDRATGAGYAGSFGDGGAGILREQVKWFNYGRGFAGTNIIPKEWDEYAKEVLKDKDPEYQEFLRLKNKFGEK